MNINPVLIVDDDTDDHDFVKESWKELGYPNKLLFFGTAEEVLHYLKGQQVCAFRKWFILAKNKQPQ